MSASHQSGDIARIGPNSIIQTFNALSTRFGEERTKAIFRSAGHEKYIGNLPSEMVNEAEFHALVKAVLEEIGEKDASEILKDSGQRTAEYLLKNRIPGIFQSLVKLMPKKLGMKLLLFAISKNAWTFAGSGAFSFEVGDTMYIRVRVSFPSKPVVAYFYGGTFYKLLRTLIDPAAHVAIEEHSEKGEIDCFYNVTLH
ncbi:bacteriochlorophyll 4-vinyl reductase [Chloroherpeton thalassium ATCC 35110]|uniref:Bacteriochlorophyll 4-vinyl reductase n=1 Tax=Chloroherpeton thalassium (strain ATCC 35110 / GB-78) TaxID=517418 RepID=B3QVP0_CHLT3|nr:bacteriochlorophyll 4-vinyl reductase [Chloroherpeton thalassium]ACF13097.1 bacteriochlorophyll 4-vinyl reductase [Chloroherpeton thalassium ATCC 35110]